MEFISHLSDIELVSAVAACINEHLPAYVRFPMRAQGQGLPGPSDHVGVICGAYYDGISDNFMLHFVVKYNDPLTNVRDVTRGKTADILPKKKRTLKTFTLNGFSNTCYFDTDVLGKYSCAYLYRRYAPSYCQLKTKAGYIRMDKVIPKYLFKYKGGHRQEIAEWLRTCAIEKIVEPLLLEVYKIEGDPRLCEIETDGRSSLVGRGKLKPPRSSKRRIEPAIQEKKDDRKKNEKNSAIEERVITGPFGNALYDVRILYADSECENDTENDTENYVKRIKLEKI